MSKLQILPRPRFVNQVSVGSAKLDRPHSMKLKGMNQKTFPSCCFGCVSQKKCSLWLGSQRAPLTCMAYTPPSCIKHTSLAVQHWVFSEKKSTPQKSPRNKKVLLNKFFRTISAGFLTQVTGKEAEACANFSNKFVCTQCFLVFLDLGWVMGPLFRNSFFPPMHVWWVS